jgi:hypothetical protein
MLTSWQQTDIRWLAVAASLLLSLLLYFFTGIPNDDAFTYLRTAEIFQQQGLEAASAHYSWTFYPVLIALVSSLGVSLLTAAYIINALLFALLVYSFVSIVRVLESNETVVALAALTILVFPELNEYREMVIRDIGFWSLGVLGLWQFLLFDRERRAPNAVYFCLALLAATLFRAEALLYLLLTPLALLFSQSQSQAQNRQDLLRVYGLAGGFMLTVLLLLWLSGVNALASLIEFVSVYQPFLTDALSTTEAETVASANAIFGEYASNFSRDYVTAVIALGLLVVLAVALFYSVGGPYFWFLVWGAVRKHTLWRPAQATPVVAYMIINLLILIVFLYLTRYLTARYAMMFGLMAVTQIPLIVSSILSKTRSDRLEKPSRYFLVLFFLYCAIDAYISFGKPKDWLTDAADYVSAAEANNVITNNRSIAYFSGRVEAYDEIIRVMPADLIKSSQPGDLLAIELFFEMQELVNDPEIGPLLQQEVLFESDGDARIGIFRRVNP